MSTPVGRLPDIAITDLDGCRTATGTVVVIDVLRAFTTAAFAFAAGAREIIPVRTIDEAFRWRARSADVLIMGERGGLPVEGFDFDNSPDAMAARSLPDAVLVQRTTSGTQGLVRAANADLLLAASFVCAEATIRRIQQADGPGVTFVVTGTHSADEGDEDRACAEYLAARLQGNGDAGPYLERVRSSAAAQLFIDAAQHEYAPEDLHRAIQLDLFDFHMAVSTDGDALRMRAGRS